MNQVKQSFIMIEVNGGRTDSRVFKPKPPLSAHSLSSSLKEARRQEIKMGPGTNTSSSSVSLVTLSVKF